MKFFEFKSEHKTKPIVYVDMDGVLADFFGKVAKEHDVEYWREIHRKDMGIDQIAKKPNFFTSLPPMKHAGHLIRGVLAIAGDYSILSSPLMSNVDQSSEEKAEWLRKYLPNHQPTSVIFDHEKYKFAQQANDTPNILIDDWETNIKLWEANGGIGILHRDEHYKNSLQQLTAALHGEIKPKVSEFAVVESEEDIITPNVGKIYTSRQVLRYVEGIHNEYHMPKPILKHKTWILRDMPISELKSPEFVHQDDPYRRVIDIDWDHVKEIPMHDIKTRPVVIDLNGWILDGNHRATAARARGLDTIPALVPYDK